MLAPSAGRAAGEPGRGPQDPPVFNFPEHLRHTPVILPSLESSLRAAFDLLMEQAGIHPIIAAEVDDMAMVLVQEPLPLKPKLAVGPLRHQPVNPHAAKSGPKQSRQQGQDRRHTARSASLGQNQGKQQRHDHRVHAPVVDGFAQPLDFQAQMLTGGEAGQFRERVLIPQAPGTPPAVHHQHHDGSGSQAGGQLM